MAIGGGIGSAIGGASSTVFTHYAADTSGMRKEVKKARGEQKKQKEEALRAAEQQNAALERKIAKWQKVGTAIGGVTAGMGALVGVMEARTQALQTFAENERLRIGALGADIEGLKEAVSGTVTETELLRFAAEATGGEFEVTQRQLENAAEAARIMAQRTGVETQQAMSDFSQALIEGGVEPLGKYGIQIDETKGSIEAFNAVNRKIGGIVEEGMTAAESAANAALERAEKNVTQWQNFKDELSEIFGTQMIPEATRNLAELGSKAQGGAKLSREEIEKLEQSLANLLARQRDLQRLEKAGFLLDIDPTSMHSIDKVRERLGFVGEEIEETKDLLSAAREQMSIDFIGLADTIEGQVVGAIDKVQAKLADFQPGGAMGPEFGPELSQENKKNWERFREQQTGEAQRQAEKAREEAKKLQQEIATGFEEAILGFEPGRQRQFTADRPDLRGSLGAGVGDATTAGIEQVDQEMLKSIEEIRQFAQEVSGGDRGVGGADPKPLESIFGVPEELDKKALKINTMTSAFKELEGVAGTAFDALTTGSIAFGEAMEKAVENAVRSLGKEMFVNSIRHGAMSLGQLAMGNPASAALHGKAAAMFGAGAAIAGAGALAMDDSSAPPDSRSRGGGRSRRGESDQDRRGGPTTIQVIVGSQFADESPRVQKARVVRAAEEGRRAVTGTVRDA